MAANHWRLLVSTTALINVFVNLFMGISLGANVLAARFYAAGKEKEMSKTVHTSIMIALHKWYCGWVWSVLFCKVRWKLWVHRMMS